MGWSKDDQERHIAIATSILPATALVGSLLGGVLAKCGRNLALRIVDIFSIIGMLLYILSVYITNVYVLDIGRTICGLTTGLNSMLVSLYIKEISPTVISGKMGVYNLLSKQIGGFVAVAIGLLITDPEKDDQDWILYVMFGLPIVTCLLRIFSLLVCFNFDTPTFYILKDDKAKAISVLKKNV
jgi:MFS family permease